MLQFVVIDALALAHSGPPQENQAFCDFWWVGGGGVGRTQVRANPLV